MQAPVPIPASPAVTKAIDKLALPGEERQHTLARIIWAFMQGDGLTEDRVASAFAAMAGPDAMVTSGDRTKARKLLQHLRTGAST